MSRSKKNFIDPSELIRDIIANDFDVQYQLIDDRDLPTAPNFLEWNIGRDYCDATLLPWQIEAGMHLFSEYCPVCSDPEFLHNLYDEEVNEIRDHVVFLESGVCPKCKKNKLELFSIGDLMDPRPSLKNEFIGNCGQRSGKSKGVVAFSSYQSHRWLKVPDPLNYFNLPKTEVVLGTFAALSADQAERNLWIPFKGLYDNSPWFKKYNEFLNSEAKRLSTPLADIKDTYVFYPHKRLYLDFTGSDDRKKRGATRLFGAMDEAAYYNSDPSKRVQKVMDADKNYASLNNSLVTIRRKALNKIAKGFYNTPIPIMYNASSPSHAMDKIMRLTKQAPQNPWAVAIHRATWELNPDFPTEQSARDIAGNVSQIEFERDFGAIPPFSDAPYIGDFRTMEKLCGDVQQIVVATPETYTDQMGDKTLFLNAKTTRTDKMTPRLLALDNGYKQNAFAAVIFRYDTLAKKPILEFAASLSPDVENRLNINFPMMFDKFLMPLLMNLNIKHVFFDRWQSIDQIQRLRDKRVNAQAHSLSYEKDFLPFKQMLLSGSMILPKIEMSLDQLKNAADPILLAKSYPIANLIWQTLTVREVGKKVTKPVEGDDDLFRAFALGGSRFLDPEIVKTYLAYDGVRKALTDRGIATFHAHKGSHFQGNQAPLRKPENLKAGAYLISRYRKPR